MYKHDAIVRAWLDGKQIQAKDAHTGLWENYPTGNPDMVPAFPPHREFRIKPEPKKTLGYKRFIFKNSFGFRVGLAQGDVEVAFDVSKQDYFVKWIDTEWQYEEFYE